MAIQGAEPKTHLVVVNHEEQYSVWAADRPVPAGWAVHGPLSGREECLTRIAVLWEDIRPLSRRSADEEETAR